MWRATRRCSPRPAVPEGVAVLADGMSGEIQEHAYWGGMRDRIPLSQTDAMSPGGEPRVIRDGARIRVVAHDNLCLIRSGQDWTDTEASSARRISMMSSRCCARAWTSCATTACPIGLLRQPLHACASMPMDV